MEDPMSQDPVEDPKETADLLAAKPDEGVLDQYLNTVPMDAQADQPAEDSLQDYADKHVESVTTPGETESAPADADAEDSVDELLAEAETEAHSDSDELPPAEEADGQETEEILLIEEEQDAEAPEERIEATEAPAPEPAETPDASEAAEAMATPPEDDALATQTTVASVVEAVLFASDEPVTVAKLAGIVECTPKQIRTSVETLNSQYKEQNRAFRIEQIAGGLQMLTLPYYDHWLRKMIKVRADNKLTPASLETLAIVAYKQPAIRADIEAIRGVASGEMLRNLMVKGMVKMVGRAEIVGRPMQYGTTKKFLECFGLNSLKDLPQIEELKAPTRKEETEPEPLTPDP